MQVCKYETLTIGVNLALFADDVYIYATERKEGYIWRKVQRGKFHVGLVWMLECEDQWG
jgi:hypothetical protein